MSKSNMLEVKLKTLCNMIGKEVGYNQGQWCLDYASCYGGYIVVEFEGNGGERHPLLNKRLKRGEMEIALDMAIAMKRGNL